MKKHFTLIALFFFSAILNAQNQYLPLLEDGKEWNYVIGHGNGADTDSISILGDTLIDGILYKKVVVFNMWSSIASLLILREDTAARQVYFRIDSAEYILYDFSLGIGDTVTILTTLPGSIFDFSPFQATVSSVDTFIDLENVHRRRIWFNWATIPFHVTMGPWIEGIGGESGFVPITMINTSISFNPNLLCAWNDGVQIYTNDDFDSCYYRLISVETFEKASFDIFPNPAIDEVVVRSKTHPIQSVKLYDLRGNVLLHQQNNTNDEEVTLNINGFASGVYVLRVESTSGWISTKKLKIQ